MHKVVTAKDQTVCEPLEKAGKANCGKIKLTATEKKDGWGQISCSFDVSTNCTLTDPLFFTLSKSDESKRNLKVFYKSECRKYGSYNGLNWTTMHTDTDTMANSDNNRQIQLKLYKYNSSGNHKMVSSGSVLYEKFATAGNLG